MSPLRIIIIVVGLGAAIGAAMLLRTALSDAASGETVQTEVQVSEVEVLTALRDLRVGETLRQEDLAWAAWPEDTVNPAQIIKSFQPDAMQDIAGRIVRIPIFANEPILELKVVDRGETGLLAALISPGMRGIALEIEVETAAGGFILPEDRVDVILTHTVEVPTSTGRTTDAVQSLVLMENVRVLAIDQGIRADDGTTLIGTTATLELSPSDAAWLALGEEKGVLSLALRSLTDAALAGDVVTSRVEDVILGLVDSDPGGRVYIYKNGRVSETNIGSGG